MDPMRESRTDNATSRWTNSRARTLARVALCGGLAWTTLVVSACGSDTTGPGQAPTPTSPVGNYSMTTANGKSLPVSLYADGTYTYDVTTGTIGLSSNGTYSLVTTYRQTIPGNVETFVDSSGGTWVATGTSISLKDGADGSTGQMTWTATARSLSFAVVDGKATNTFVYTLK
jgi:hypothetical protein